jgi:hypothetical protein
MEVQSEPDDAGTPVTVVTSRHSAPSDDTVVAAITTIPDVTESIKEDTTSSHVVTVTDPQAMDVDKAPLAETVIVNVNLGADADADGETDADAEGEDDDELDAEGEPDDEL